MLFYEDVSSTCLKNPGSVVLLLPTLSDIHGTTVTQFRPVISRSEINIDVPMCFPQTFISAPTIQILVLRFKVLGPVLGAPFCQMLLQCSTICRAERMNVPLSQFLESTDVSELQNSKMPTSNSTFTTSFQGLSKSPIICFSTVFFLVPPKYFNVFNPTFGRDVPFAACVFNSSQ